MHIRLLFILSLYILSLHSISYLDFNEMYNGVTDVSYGGIWSPVSFSDPNKAISLLNSNQTSYIAVAEAGLGRAVAFGKDSIYYEFGTADNGRFIANIIQWAAKRKNKIQVLSYMNILYSNFSDAINAIGTVNITLTQTSVLPSNFSGVDVFVMGFFYSVPADVNATQIAQLVNFVKNGGGILSAGMTWVWLAYGDGRNSSKNIMTDFFNNMVMGPLGLYHINGPNSPVGVSPIQIINCLTMCSGNSNSSNCFSSCPTSYSKETCSDNYFNQTNSQCYANCPSGFYGNRLSGFCESPCPSGYYGNGGLCLLCDFNCAYCSVNSSNCYTCQYSWLGAAPACSNPTCFFYILLFYLKLNKTLRCS